MSSRVLWCLGDVDPAVSAVSGVVVGASSSFLSPRGCTRGWSWRGGTRTAIAGVRARCPAVRRLARGASMTRQGAGSPRRNASVGTSLWCRLRIRRLSPRAANSRVTRPSVESGQCRLTSSTGGSMCADRPHPRLSASIRRPTGLPRGIARATEAQEGRIALVRALLRPREGVFSSPVSVPAPSGCMVSRRGKSSRGLYPLYQ